MSYFQETSKILKHCLKKKVGISASLIVTFLIAGTLSSSVLAQDTRGRENNSIHSAKIRDLHWLRVRMVQMLSIFKN